MVPLHSLFDIPHYKRKYLSYPHRLGSPSFLPVLERADLA